MGGACNLRLERSPTTILVFDTSLVSFPDETPTARLLPESALLPEDEDGENPSMTDLAGSSNTELSNTGNSTSQTSAEIEEDFTNRFALTSQHFNSKSKNLIDPRHGINPW